MGYGPNFPASQLGGSKFLWVFIEYGLLGIWVTVGVDCNAVVEVCRNMR